MVSCIDANTRAALTRRLQGGHAKRSEETVHTALDDLEALLQTAAREHECGAVGMPRCPQRRHGCHKRSVPAYGHVLLWSRQRLQAGPCSPARPTADGAVRAALEEFVMDTKAYAAHWERIGRPFVDYAPRHLDGGAAAAQPVAECSALASSTSSATQAGVCDHDGRAQHQGSGAGRDGSATAGGECAQDGQQCDQRLPADAHELIVNRMTRRHGWPRRYVEVWVTEMEKFLGLKAQACDAEATILSPSGVRLLLAFCIARALLCRPMQHRWRHQSSDCRQSCSALLRNAHLPNLGRLAPVFWISSRAVRARAGAAQ